MHPEQAMHEFDPLMVEPSDEDPSTPESDQRLSVRRKRAFYVLLPTGAVLLFVAMATYFTTSWPADVSQPQDVIGLSVRSAELYNNQKVDILYETNAYRCMHSALPVVWNPTVAWSAQKQVDKLGFGHSSGTGYGENLAWSSHPKVTKMVDNWYSEVKSTGRRRGKVTGFSSGTGHYTQLVWKGTKKIGCGMSQKTLNCEYSPAGNFAGRYNSNVGATAFSWSQCKGAGHSTYSRSYGTPKSGDKWQIKQTCYCSEVCRWSTKNKYYWCGTKGCGNTWDYCTPPSNGSPKTAGCSCTSVCDYGSKDKTSCKLYKESSCPHDWDYCTPAPGR